MKQLSVNSTHKATLVTSFPKFPIVNKQKKISKKTQVQATTRVYLVKLLGLLSMPTIQLLMNQVLVKVQQQINLIAQHIEWITGETTSHIHLLNRLTTKIQVQGNTSHTRKRETTSRADFWLRKLYMFLSVVWTREIVTNSKAPKYLVQELT